MEYLYANNLEQARMYRTEPNISHSNLCANKKFRLAGVITVCSFIIGIALFFADRGRGSYALIISVPFLIIATIGLLCLLILCGVYRKFTLDTSEPRPPMGTPETTVAVISREGTDQLQTDNIIPPPRSEDAACPSLSINDSQSVPNSRIEASVELSTRRDINSQIQAESGLASASLRGTETGPIRRAIAPVHI